MTVLSPSPSMTAAEAILRRLRQHGVRYLFANAGTDFAPIIEAYEATAEDQRQALPIPVAIPHETAAVAMAHGYYLATGQPQAVMVHVNVGLANAVMGLINANSDNIPILMLAGRTPVTEYQRDGSRMTPIQYGQEMRDQSAMIREVVKWDYELRYGEQAVDAVDRAVSIAMTQPQGPVFLALPREPLAEPVTGGRDLTAPLSKAAAPACLDPDTIAALAQRIAASSNPLIICQRGDVEGRLAKALGTLATDHAIGVVEPFPMRNIMASDHPMHLGYQLNDHLKTADLVVVLDSPVPWIQRFMEPNDGCFVAHIGQDPLFQALPMRSHRSDLAIQADPAEAILALTTELTSLGHGNATRFARLSQANAERLQNQAWVVAQQSEATPITPAWVAQVLGSLLEEGDSVYSELGPPPGPARPKAANTWFTPPYSGGLGWGLPAALGAKLAEPERLVISCVGDGSYMFANPVVCHQIAEALSLPLLTVIMNNQSWNATRRAVHNMYPDGHAAASASPVMTDLAPSPDFCAVAAASRAWTACVSQPADLAVTLRNAIEVVKKEQRQALVEVRVAKTDGF